MVGEVDKSLQLVLIWRRSTVTFTSPGLRRAIRKRVEEMTTDKIQDIIDRAIVYTEDILAQAPRHYGVAREGLEQMLQNLRIGAEDHPALQLLEDYLDELQRRCTN